mgnify:CR=1 FL=1
MKLNKEYMQGYEMSFWTQFNLSVLGMVSFLVFMSLFAN